MSRTKRSEKELSDAKGIRKRLIAVYDIRLTRGKGQDGANGGLRVTGLGKRLALEHTTVSGWFQDPPQTPGVHHLIRMARSPDRISLNYLLLGEGPERLGQLEAKASLADKVRAHLLAEVRPRLGRVPGDLVERWLPSGEEILEQAAVSYATEVEAKYAVYRERFFGDRARLHESEMVDYHIGEALRHAKSQGTDAHERVVAQIKDALGEELASGWIPPAAEGSVTPAPPGGSPDSAAHL